MTTENIVSYHMRRSDRQITGWAAIEEILMGGKQKIGGVSP